MDYINKLNLSLMEVNFYFYTMLELSKFYYDKLINNKDLINKINLYSNKKVDYLNISEKEKFLIKKFKNEMNQINFNFLNEEISSKIEKEFTNNIYSKIDKNIKEKEKENINIFNTLQDINDLTNLEGELLLLKKNIKYGINFINLVLKVIPNEDQKRKFRKEKQRLLFLEKKIEDLKNYISFQCDKLILNNILNFGISFDVLSFFREKEKNSFKTEIPKQYTKQYMEY